MKACSPRRSDCSVPGCDRRHHAQGFCDPHYRRTRRTGEPGPAVIETQPPAPRRVGCLVQNCERPHRAKGYCNVHYNRQCRYGDAEAPLRTGGRAPGFRLPVVGYHGVHRRLRTTRGPASTHPCQHCGGAATAWAYTNDDPDERVDAAGRYSLDLDRYIPLCGPCHSAYDAAHQAATGVVA